MADLMKMVEELDMGSLGDLFDKLRQTLLWMAAEIKANREEIEKLKVKTKYMR